MEQTGDLGLRERKKIATREALAEAAVRLALRDGPENVRVPDIAAEAGVSPRTFNNYFSSVPEAICALASERALGIGDKLRQRPVAESLATAITHAMLDDYAEAERNRDFSRMIYTSPVLHGEFFKTVMARERVFAQAIAERVGAPEDDTGPQLLSAAYFGMARVVGHRRLCGETGGDLDGMLRAGLALLAPAAAAFQGSMVPPGTQLASQHTSRPQHAA